MAAMVSSRIDAGMPWLITWKKPHVLAASLIWLTMFGRCWLEFKLERSIMGIPVDVFDVGV